MTGRARNIIFIILGALLVLCIPLVAMQFTDGVNWSLSDFVIAFGLLLAVGLVYELIVRRLQNKVWRYVVAVIVALLFLLLWVQLAVGILN